MAWVEAFHIIFVVCWFAGIFYLPRLFVYHAMSDDATSKERFIIMERKLYFGIATPCAVITLGLGFWLLSAYPAFMSMGWMHVKLTAVALLLAYHISCYWFMIRFKEDRNTHSHVFFRWFNEAPVLLLIAIVIMVVVKPF